nr:MAG TPA: hypothetical protein [Caudoviricetes sp.]
MVSPIRAGKLPGKCPQSAPVLPVENFLDFFRFFLLTLR